MYRGELLKLLGMEWRVVGWWDNWYVDKAIKIKRKVASVGELVIL